MASGLLPDVALLQVRAARITSGWPLRCIDFFYGGRDAFPFLMAWPTARGRLP